MALLKGSANRGTHRVAIHNSTNCGRWCVGSASAQRTAEDVKESMAGMKIFVNYLRVKENNSFRHPVSNVKKSGIVTPRHPTELHGVVLNYAQEELHFHLTILHTHTHTHTQT